MWTGLFPYQRDAISKMKNGCILCGDVGSGKSRTAIAYYYKTCGGDIDSEDVSYMPDPPRDLYIITTAQKRDKCEWLSDLSVFLITPNPDISIYHHKVVIDSWNNIKKYEKVYGAFFIFDEQRVVGYGAWVKAFLKIANKNKWILLSATPGDKWMDYVPVFIANGFYKNKTEFNAKHVVYRYGHNNYPIIERYIGEGTLMKLKNDILIPMDYHHEINKHDQTILCDYDRIAFKQVAVKHWNIYEDCPIENVSSYYFLLRRVVNSDESRSRAVLDIFKKHPRLIIFYNFNYELDILKKLDYGKDVPIAEWNGFKHDRIPNADSWIYLVQYTAGAEGWNCIQTNAIVFYSQTYSYKVLKQSAGRIDRLNTPFSDLYYYHFRSGAWIDSAIQRALMEKRNFNESEYEIKIGSRQKHRV